MLVWHALVRRKGPITKQQAIRQKYSLSQRQLLLEAQTSHIGGVKLCDCDY